LAAMRRVSNHEAILRDASLRDAPQDEVRASQRSAARILGGAGYAVVPLFSSSENAEGTERRAAHQSSVLPRPLLENAGASRRSIAASSGAGPRFRLV
jgi:hypothetical protein